MFVLNIILGYQMYVGVLEIVIFLLGAVVLGFFIHFFMTSRRSMPASIMEPSVLAESHIPDNDEWRIKYSEDMEEQEQVQAQLRQDLEEAKSNEEILDIEIEELRKEIKQLQENPQKPQQQPETAGPADYLNQLKSAHDSFFAHNQNIARLIEQIEILKDSEQKHLDTLNDNEMLHAQLSALRSELSEKEGEIKQMHQQSQLAKEMEERLGRAYDEFNVLREKLQRVEGQLSQPQNRQFEYNELQQNYFKLTKDFDEIKLKHLSMVEENQRLSRILADVEDKLRESNFQRQQLHKKVGFLEELNRDMLQISEQNKKLENQLKRMSEIEMLLARVAEKGTTEDADKSSDQE